MIGETLRLSNARESWLEHHHGVWARTFTFIRFAKRVADDIIEQQSGEEYAGRRADAPRQQEPNMHFAGFAARRSVKTQESLVLLLV